MQDKLEVIKNVTAAGAAAGEIGLSFTSLSGNYLMLARLILALFLLFWGCFERNNPRSLYRSLAWLAVIFGSAITLGSLTILVLLQTNNPRLWADRSPVVYEERFSLRKQGERYYGSYRPRFDRDADFAEVRIIPASTDRNHVADLVINRIESPPADRENIREVQNGDDTSLTVEVVGPTANYNFVLHMQAEARGNGLSPPEIRPLAQYKYIKHDALWRLRRWAHDRYAR